MLYLIQNPEPFDFCLECECNNAGCYDQTCTTETCFMNRDGACPKHCWAQVCTKAKVDPFNFTL